MSLANEFLSTTGPNQLVMTTSKQQISIFTEDESTSSAEGFRANLTPSQEKDLEKKMTATSGQKCLEQFGRFNHAGSWAKTFSGYLIGMKDWYSMRSTLTWKLRAIGSRRMYFQLYPLTHPIEETGSGLLPTPCANDIQPPQERRIIVKNGRYIKKNKGSGAEYGPKLVDIAGLLPTPRAGMTSGISAKGEGIDLPEAAKQMTGKTSQLNPPFVAEMMGFPTAWTTLPFLSGEENPSKPTETQ